MSLNIRALVVPLALLVFWSAFASLACFGGEPAPTPVAVVGPAATSTVPPSVGGGLSPELTRRAVDTLRQRDHMSTLIASRPTETPVPGEELNRPPPGLPSERGVWWYKGGGGDHTGAALLFSHPYGEALDLLDGRIGEDYFPRIGDQNREMMLDGLVRETVDLVSAAERDSAGFYTKSQIGLILRNRMVGGLAWEAASTSEPYVRVWTQFEWEGIDGPVIYRVGAIGVVEVVAPEEDDRITKRYVGRLEQIPRFSHYSDTPILERVSSDR